MKAARNDAIRRYGETGSRIILQQMSTLPVKDRSRFLRETLQRIGISKQVDKRKDYGLGQAIATSLSEKHLTDVLKAARGEPTGPIPMGSLFGSIASGVTSAVSTVTGGVKDAVTGTVNNTVGLLNDARCKLASTKVGVIAGAAGSTAVGAGPTAGVVGTQLLATGCGGGTSASTTAPVRTAAVKQQPKKWVPYAILGGGAIIALIIIFKK